VTAAGYITDRRCPTNPEHGKVWDMNPGYYCPHHDHNPPKQTPTKSWWTENEFELAKTEPPPTPTDNSPIKIKIEKKTNGRTKRLRRRAR
jgi:hypothetical protein